MTRIGTHGSHSNIGSQCIYVGENKVIHFTASQKDASSGSSSNSNQNVVAHGLTHLECGFHKQGSGVALSCLKCFIKSGSLYLFQYGVNTITSISKLRSGTCTTAASDPPQEVIHRAMFLLQNGFGNYNLFENNCEDFALYCKTGLLVCGNNTGGRSGQVNHLINNLNIQAVMGNSAVLMVTMPIIPEIIIYMVVAGVVGVAATAGVKYNADLGNRQDVIKVSVENLVSYYARRTVKHPKWTLEDLP